MKLELPESWVEGRLEQLVTVKSGIGFPHEFQGKLNGEFPVYKVGDLSRAVLQNNGYLSSAGNYVNADVLPQLKGVVFPKGSTLFAKIGEAVKLNRRAFVEVEGLADNNVMSVIPYLEQSQRFIYYFLKTIDLSDVSRSTTVPSIRKGDIESLLINWPPLTEQQVIADKLDTLLAQVESIKARLERIPEILKKFRQSVLAAAVSGKLTEEWREGKPFKYDKGFLSDFASIDVGYAFKSNEFSSCGIPLLRGQNIEPGGLKWEDTKYFPETKIKDVEHLFLKENEIILAMDRPIISTGLKLARVKGTDLPCLLVQRVARFKGFKNLEPDFLYILLSELSFVNYIQPTQTGSDIPHISGKQILSFIVEVPSLEEQVEIVKTVYELNSFVNHIEVQLESALNRVNYLTQSILSKAFSGELTAEWRQANPDLIRGEHSAEALLQKIKAEKMVKAATKRGRGKE